MIDVVRKLNASRPLSLSERYPELAETLQRAAEAERRALSQPSVAEVHQTEMGQALLNIQRESHIMQMKVQKMIFEKRE